MIINTVRMILISVVSVKLIINETEHHIARCMKRYINLADAKPGLTKSLLW